MKSPEYAAFRGALFLTLSLGSLLIERGRDAASFLLYPLLYAFALVAQDWLHGELPFHPAETHGDAKDEGVEFIFSGSRKSDSPGPRDESRYLRDVAAVELRRGAALVAVFTAFLVLRPLFYSDHPTPGSAAWHLIAALLLVPAASLNHFMLPLGLQALLVTSYLAREDSPIAPWAVYFLCFLTTLLLFQIVRRHLVYGCADQDPPRLDGQSLESLVKSAGLLAVLLLICNGIVVGQIQNGLSRLSAWAKSGVEKPAQPDKPRSPPRTPFAIDGGLGGLSQEGLSPAGDAGGSGGSGSSAGSSGGSSGGAKSAADSSGPGGARSGGSAANGNSGGQGGASSGGDSGGGGGSGGNARSSGDSAAQGGLSGGESERSARGESGRSGGGKSRSRPASQDRAKTDSGVSLRDFTQKAVAFLKLWGPAALAAAALIFFAISWLKKRRPAAVPCGAAAEGLKLLDSLSMNDLSAREQVIAKYKIFLNGMAKALAAKEDFLPPTDYCLRLRTLHPGLGLDFASINDLFCRTLYADRGVTAEELFAYDQALGRVFRNYGELRTWVDLAHGLD